MKESVKMAQIISREVNNDKTFPSLTLEFLSFAQEWITKPVICIAGPSRQGKTTLLNTMLGTAFKAQGGFQPITMGMSYGVGTTSGVQSIGLDLEGSGRADGVYDQVVAAIALICANVFIINHLGGIDMHSIARSVDTLLTTTYQLTESEKKLNSHLVVVLRDTTLEDGEDPMAELQKLHPELVKRAQEAFLSFSIVPLTDIRSLQGNMLDEKVSGLRQAINHHLRTDSVRCLPGTQVPVTPEDFTDYIKLLCERSKEKGRVPTFTSLATEVNTTKAFKLVDACILEIQEHERSTIGPEPGLHEKPFGNASQTYSDSVKKSIKEKLRGFLSEDDPILIRELTRISTKLESFISSATAADRLREERIAREQAARDLKAEQLAREKAESQLKGAKSNPRTCMHKEDYAQVALRLFQGDVAGALTKAASHKWEL